MAFLHTRAALLSSGMVLVGMGAAAQDNVTVLDPIVLGYGGSDKVATETPQAVTVVDQEEIDRQQATTVGELLDSAPGVQAIGSGRIMGESYNIRGVGGSTAADESKIIITLDGAAKSYEQYRLGSVFLDPELMKRVEVLRGPASSTLYGSGAIGGVINFETKDPEDFLDGTTQALRLKGSYGSNGNERGASVIYATQPTDAAGLLFALNKRKADNYEDGDGEEISGSEYDANSVLLKGRFNLGGNQSVMASYVRLWGNWNDTEYSQTDNASFGTVDRELRDQTLTLRYENESDNPLLDLDVTLTYADSQVKQFDASGVAFGDQVFGCAPGTFSIFCDSEYGYTTTSLGVENNMEFGGAAWGGFVTVGAKYSHQDRKAEFESFPLSTHPEGTDDRLAIYAQGEFTFGDRLTLFPGLRVEQVDQSSDKRADVSEVFISPKLAVLYEISDTWGVFGSVARTERAPTIDELYSVDRDEGPSLSLTPEKGTSYELGATASFYDVFAQGDGMVFKATVFRSNVQDQIARSSGADTPYYVNLPGETETEGFELEGAYESERVFARLALSMTQGDDDAGYPRGSIPADNLHLTLGGKNDQRGLRYGWAGHFYKDIEYAPSVVRGQTITNETPGYATHDLFFEWTAREGMAKGIRVGLTAKNVFDREYQNALAGTNGAGRSFDLNVSKVFEF